VAEQGTHAELLTLGGLYAQLHSVQFEPPAGAGVPA
jgi:ABC-type multidrug transport system fused ATPase/permease subunit